MSRWFRMYDDVVNDPKVLCLSSDALRWQWVALLCVASKNGGKLPAIAHVAVTLRLPPQRAAAVLVELHQAELLDKLDDGTFVPHNWNGRQYQSDSSAERMRRHRLRKTSASPDITDSVTCDVTGDVTVTVQSTDTDTDTDNRTEQMTIADAMVAAAPPGPDIAPLQKASRQKPKRSLPDGFEIAVANVSYAKSLGFSDFEIKREHQKFCMSAKANGRAYSDWHAAQHNWITKAAEFAGKRPRGEWDIPDDGLIEVLDQFALEAWDEYGIKTTGKGYPRNKKGGWRHPHKWPPGYEDQMISGMEKLLAAAR